MVINYFEVKKIISYNSKTDAVLCINSNAVLPFAISMKQFQMIGRRNS